MKQKIYKSFFLLFSIFLLTACRNEESTDFEKKKVQNTNNSFQIFSKVEGENNMFSKNEDLYAYQEAFRDLYFLYFQNNLEKAPIFGNEDLPHIDFRYASEVFYMEDSTKLVLFPFIVKSEVENIVVCTINKENDFVKYYLAENIPFINEAIATFSNIRNSNSTMSRNCGFDHSDDACPIEEVVITVPKPTVIAPIESNPWDDYFPPWGGCEVYDNCGGGGSSPSPVVQPPPIQNPDPCSIGKSVGANADAKAKFQILKGRTTSSAAEDAYIFNTDGSTSYQQGDINTGELKLSFTSGKVDMVLHSQYAGLYSTFSISDVFAMAWMHKQGLINDLNTFSFGVVTASATQYLLVISDKTKFNNFVNKVINQNGDISLAQLKAYEGMYTKYVSASPTAQSANETGFTKLLDMTNMGLKVLKGSSDFSNWNPLNQNSQGQVSPQTCN